MRWPPGKRILVNRCVGSGYAPKIIPLGTKPRAIQGRSCDVFPFRLYFREEQDNSSGPGIRWDGAHAGYMDSEAHSTDEHLMDLLSQGEDEALADLVERYQNDVFRFCLHYLKGVETAKEMTQETFLRIYAARGRFDVSRKFKPWMLCIARNLCLNELKRKKTVRMETLEAYASSARGEDGHLLQCDRDGPAETLAAKERQSALMRVLDELPEGAREIVMLRYFEGMSAREIAEVIDSTEGAVRTRLHRVLRQLRERCEALKDEF